MYTVVINYNGLKTVQDYKTEKEAMKRYASWYAHGLDMSAQVKSNIDIWHNGQCIWSDTY